MQFKQVAGGAALLALALVLAVPARASAPVSSERPICPCECDNGSALCPLPGHPEVCVYLLCERGHAASSPVSAVTAGIAGSAGSPSARRGPLAWLFAFSLLAFGLTITPLLPANEPVPKNSYAASVAVLAADASPVSIPHELNFTPTILRMCFSALGSATAGATGPVPTITADGTNIYIAHATGANTGFTASVEALRPTTNNAP
jgi:hypothetical protein